MAEPIHRDIREEPGEHGLLPPGTDVVIRPEKGADLSAGVRGEIDAVYRKGWLATYLQNAFSGNATPNKTVHALLDKAIKEPITERRLEARRAILHHILPKGITVNSRPDIHELIKKMVLLGIHPVLWERSDQIKLGVRPGKEQKDRVALDYDEIVVDIKRFPISTKAGAPLTNFAWRGEGIMEKRLPAPGDA